MAKLIILVRQVHINPLFLEVSVFHARQVPIVKDQVPDSSEKIVSLAQRELSALQAPQMLMMHHHAHKVFIQKEVHPIA